MIITVIILWAGIDLANSQEISTQILGKWALKEVEIMGQKGSPLEVFGVTEAYQKYTKPNKFIGCLGEKVTGHYTIESNTIKVEINKEITIFKIKKMEARKMELNLKTEEGIITLYYNKVND